MGQTFDDEFEREFGDGGESAPAEVDEFAAEFESAAAPANVAKVAGTPQPPPSQPRSGLDVLLEMAGGAGRDFAMGVGDGASMGHGKWLAGLGQKTGDAAFGLLHPDQVPTERSGGEDIGGQMMDAASNSAAGKLGQGVGAVATAVGSGAVAPATKLGQAGAGAVLGGLDAHGRGESVLGGAALGGGLGLLGGLAGQKLHGALSGPAMRMGVPSTGTRAGQIAETLGSYVPGKDVYASVAKQAIEPGLESLAGLARGAGRTLSGFAGLAGDEAVALAAPKAKAQDTGWSVETGDAEMYQNGVRANIGEPQVYPEPEVKVEIGEPRILDDGWNVQTGEAQIRDNSPAATQSWAVESVLYQGNTGLPREAEQQLTEAALSGDPEKLATATFLLSGRYPQFSDALQKQRSSLIREED